MSEQYLIWSNEHRAWWGPRRHGYTTQTHEAGRYGHAEAAEIVDNANRYLRGDVPNEVMVLAPSQHARGAFVPIDVVNLDWLRDEEKPKGSP